MAAVRGPQFEKHWNSPPHADLQKKREQDSLLVPTMSSALTGGGGGTLIKSDTKHPYIKILEKIKYYAKLISLCCQNIVMVTPLREKTETVIYLGNGNL
jgi:hypothetical protein